MKGNVRYQLFPLEALLAYDRQGSSAACESFCRTWQLRYGS